MIQASSAISLLLTLLLVLGTVAFEFQLEGVAFSTLDCLAYTSDEVAGYCFRPYIGCTSSLQGARSEYHVVTRPAHVLAKLPVLVNEQDRIRQAANDTRVVLVNRPVLGALFGGVDEVQFVIAFSEFGG